MPVRQRLLGFLIATLFASPASVQGWDWRVTPYLWTTGIEGDVALGPIGRDVDFDFSDIVDVLDGAALMQVEAQNDRHIVFGDLAWFAVGPEDEVATIGGVAEVELDATIVELGYARDSDGFGLELGLRYWDSDLEIDPALAAGVIRSDSWTDVFAGVRNTRDLDEDWTMTTRASLGAGGADLSIGVQMELARKLAGGNAIVAGLRIINVDREKEAAGGIPLVLDVTFFGATAGFKFD
jgi:hypothetical protein